MEKYKNKNRPEPFDPPTPKTIAESIDVINVFLRFFILVTFFTFVNVF